MAARKAVVRWEEPPRPDTYRRRTDWTATAEALTKRPDRWAVVAVFSDANRASHTAWMVRNGTYMAMRPAGTFDACARNVDGEYRVYARYLGETS